MDLSLSDEQKQLQDAAERFVRDKYTFENRRKIAATEQGLAAGELGADRRARLARHVRSPRRTAATAAARSRP